MGMGNARKADPQIHVQSTISPKVACGIRKGNIAYNSEVTLLTILKSHSDFGYKILFCLDLIPVC